MMNDSWPEARMDELRRLWDEGKSARVIAEEMGLKSRNQVIGKAHRMGLPPRQSPIKRKQPNVVDIDAYKRSCEWPFGNPGEEGFHFCGEAAAPSKPYCKQHCKLAYRGFPPRKGTNMKMRQLTAFEVVK